MLALMTSTMQSGQTRLARLFLTILAWTSCLRGHGTFEDVEDVISKSILQWY
jgi:hypothetical protein